MNSLDRIRTFVEFVNSGSMSAAAKKLGITQPAVSQQLYILEKSCPKPLFFNQGTRKVLTSFGRRLYETCHPLITEALEKISRLRKQNTQESTIIAGRENVLEKILERIDVLPGVFEIIGCSSTDAANMISNHDVSLAITHMLPNSSNLIAKMLFISRPVIAFNKIHFPKLAKKSILTLDQNDLLKNLVLCYRKDDPALVQLCKLKDISVSNLQFGLVAPSWPIIQRAAKDGKGIAILPSEYVGNLDYIDLQDSCIPTFTYYLVYPKGSSKNPILKKWIDTILSVQFC